MKGWRTHIVPELPGIEPGHAHSLTYGQIAEKLVQSDGNIEDNDLNDLEFLICRSEILRRSGKILESVQMLDLAREIGIRSRSPMTPHVFWAKANIARQIGDYTSSLRDLSFARSFSTGRRPPLGSAAIGAARAEIIRIRGDFTLAWKLHSELEEFFMTIGDSRGFIWALQGKAQILLASGELSRAHKLFELSGFISREVGDLRSVAFSIRGMANIMIEIGDTDSASILLFEALDIFSNLGYILGCGYVWRSIGNLNLKCGNVFDAEKCFEIADQTFIRAEHPRGRFWVAKSRSLLQACSKSNNSRSTQFFSF